MKKVDVFKVFTCDLTTLCLLYFFFPSRRCDSVEHHRELSSRMRETRIRVAKLFVKLCRIIALMRNEVAQRKCCVYFAHKCQLDD